jgi:hypothetical protein
VSLNHNLGKMINLIQFVVFSLINSNKERFECLIFGFKGPYVDVHPLSVHWRYAKCWKCGTLKRHRIQYPIAKKVVKNEGNSTIKMLYFAPEPFLENFSLRNFISMRQQTSI